VQLEQGYEVVGTIRTPSRIEEVKKAISAQGLPPDKLSFVEADLLKDAGWDKAVAGCDYVLHVASPFIVGLPKHEDELIVPAVEGTRRVIEASIKAGVKKIVLTSSCAAIVETHDGKTHYSETDWTDANHKQTPAYYKSKTLAEQKAWALIKAQTGAKPTKLAVINPAGVIGPTLSDDIGTANEIVRQIIAGEVPGCPRVHLGFVDVRDVAAAHILAMTNDAADGERFIISEHEFWFKEFCEILQQAGFDKAPLRELPNWLVKVIALLKPDTRQIANMVGQARYTPADKARKILGWKPRSAVDSLLDTAAQLVEKGIVQR
jgi:dihydroflavonol-4-reductase